MATTSNTYTGNGSNKLFSITFPYIATSDINVYLNGTLQTFITQYTFANATTVEFVAAPANGTTVLLQRSTDDTDIQATFFPGSSIKATDLNENFNQILYVAQETSNNMVNAVAGQIPDGTITNVKLATNAVSTDKISNNAVTSAKIADGSITDTKLASNSVTSAKITDGNVTNVKLAANAVNTANIVDGSVTTVKLATASVHSTTLADGSVTNVKLAASSVSSTNIIDDTIVNADVNATAGIQATKLAITTGSVTRTVDSKLKDIVSVKDYGAVGNGVVDDSAAITAALAASQNVKVPKGTYYLGSTITIPLNFSLETDYGVEFTGPGLITRNGVVIDYSSNGLGPQRLYNLRVKYIQDPDTEINNLFETAQFRVAAGSGRNAIVGAVVQSGPGSSFPCGITGYGKQNNAGNQAFGVFGRADLYQFGLATNELNTFNYKAGPPGTFPPNRSFGITNAIPVSLTIAAGGNFQSLIGIQICKEGSEPQNYVCGLYTNPDGCTTYGLWVDSTSTAGPIEAIKANFRGDLTNNYGFVTQYKVASPSASARFIQCFDNAGGTKFAVKPSGQLVFGSGLTQTTRGTAGAATTLPSNPTGYLTVEINGSTKVIPYYES